MLDLERDRLRDAGRSDLADQVVHASVDEGDGLGYDIRSFDDHGRVRYIEVKTTVGNERTPFLISAREVRFSIEEANNYSLHRVYDVEGTPGCYVLDGDLRDHVDLKPTEFLARR